MRANATKCKVPEGYELEHFMLKAGDFSVCADVISEAWVESYKNEGGAFAFTPETFEIVFGSPTIKRNLFLRIRHLESKEVVGFLGAVPRALKFPDGKKYEYCIPSCLSVRSDHQGRDLGTCMVLKGLEISKESSLDGLCLFFETEHPHPKRIIERVLGNDLKHVCMVKRFVSRVLDVEKVSKCLKPKWHEKLYLKAKSRLKRPQKNDSRTLEYGDISKLYELSKDFEKRNDVSIVREWKDFEWYMKLPCVVTAVHDGRDGSPDGFISAWPAKLSGFGSTCNMGLIDMIHTYNLDMTAASNLAARLCLIADEKGWAGLTTPFIPYFSAKPFLKSRFILFPKSLDVSMLSLSGHKIPKRVKSLYLDWR